MLLPLRSKNPPESFPVATVALIAVNILVFALTVDSTLHIRPEFLSTLALSWSGFNPLNLVSHMFVHENFLHILGNMWFLYLFGFAVEGRLKAGRFLLLYFASGILGSLLQLLLFGRSGVYLVGASAAIMGVLGAALYLFPYSQVEFAIGISPRLKNIATWNMVWVAFYFFGMDMVFALFQGSGPGVARLAHIGGAAAGLGICALMKVRRDTREESEAKAMLVEFKDLSLPSSHELAAMAVNNPDNTALVLHWMQRNIRDGSIRSECLIAFNRLLPEIIRNEPAPYVGDVLISLTSVGMPIATTHILRVARSMESVDEPTLAIRLYNCVLRNPASRAADIEAALFRSALASERLDNRQQAAHNYSLFIERFPMSPMAIQARMRLGMLPAA